MPSHEYRVVPAPRRSLRVRGARRPEDRFARTVEGEMNRMAAQGWEFVRSDTLPREHKPGWFSRPVTVFETLLVFRREVAEVEAESAMPPLRAPPHSEAPPPFVAAPAATRTPPPPVPANDAPDGPPAFLLAEPPDQEPGPEPGPEPRPEPAETRKPRHAAE